MKRLKTSMLGLILINSCFAQLLNPDWSFQTSDRIIASPLIQRETIFVGNERGDFYALDLNGKEKWKFETGGNIQAKATWVDGNIFFESANIFYLVNANNGKQIWKFDPDMTPFIFDYDGKKFPYKIDPYDDKRSTAFLYEGVIYVGCGNGKLYGLDAKNGTVEFEYSVEGNFPIRSSPMADNGKLYFGDWDGFVYCYSLPEKKLLWKKKTYRGEKPYGTFGGVVSEFIQYEGQLFFGARNYMLNVLDIKTGEKEWTYTDAKKGWVIGDPVIYSDTLYIGGSDNYSMLAFDPVIGRPIWSQNGGKNIYTKPVETEDWLIYTAGNGYDPNDNGVLFLLNRSNGAVIDQYELPMGSFSSPTLKNNQVVFGCYDGKIYSVKIE